MRYTIQFDFGRFKHSEELFIDRRSTKDAQFNHVLEAKLKERFSTDHTDSSQLIHFFPALDQYTFTFEEPSKSKEPYIITHIKSTNTNIHFKIVHILLADATHHFVLPIDKEIGDYVPVPTGTDEKFQTHYRARASAIMYRKSIQHHPGLGPRLWLHLEVNQITFQGVENVVKDCEIYHYFKQGYVEGKCVTERLQNDWIDSLKTAEVWFWYNPRAKNPLEDDADAVVAWLLNYAERQIEEPTIHKSINSAAIVATTTDLDNSQNTEQSNQVEFFNEDKDTELLVSRLMTSCSIDERTARERVRGRQRQFRREVLKQCGSKCILTEINIPQVLEAAHIVPVSEAELDEDIMDPCNGIALRIDIHRLFDAHLLRFELNPNSSKVTLVLDSSVKYIHEIEHGMEVTNFPKDPRSHAFLKRRMDMLS